VLEQVRTALVIAPHPDDEVLGVGGTIAKLVRQGADVHVAIVTRGQAPRFTAEAVERVGQECTSAHRRLGVKQTHYLDLPAAELDRVPHSELNARIGDLVSQIAPDTLFLPFVGDIHLDHQLVFTSALVASRPRHGNVPVRILAYETLSETNWWAPGITPPFVPNIFIDIADTLDAKLEAFAEFRSQVKAAPDERSPEVIRALALVRGAAVYRTAAEAFMLVRQVG
jgi:LmbE family N-acetylglucosaminyl deacetylase